MIKAVSRRPRLSIGSEYLRSAKDHDSETVASVVDGEPEPFRQGLALGTGLFLSTFRVGVDEAIERIEGSVTIWADEFAKGLAAGGAKLVDCQDVTAASNASVAVTLAPDAFRQFCEVAGPTITFRYRMEFCLIRVCRSVVECQAEVAD